MKIMGAHFVGDYIIYQRVFWTNLPRWKFRFIFVYIRQEEVLLLYIAHICHKVNGGVGISMRPYFQRSILSIYWFWSQRSNWWVVQIQIRRNSRPALLTSLQKFQISIKYTFELLIPRIPGTQAYQLIFQNRAFHFIWGYLWQILDPR